MPYPSENNRPCQSVPVERFMQLAETYPVFDVRTPDEYARGHIPGAHNLPLFSNEERTVIGTLYKQEGREPAVLKGLEFVGPKMRQMVETVRGTSGRGPVLVHCWRGGMRSGSVGWLLSTAGIPVYLLEGGYKSFRRYVLAGFEIPRAIYILSGATGTGKTEILQHLKAMGEQVIDLEGLAHHKGSSFGAIGELPQPTQQQFENELSLGWRRLDPERPVWLEDESQCIGRCTIPQPLWQQMRQTTVIFLDMPRPLRTQRLQQDYGAYSPEALKAAILRLEKRLGGEKTRVAVRLLEAGELPACIELLLRDYYDKTYRYGLSRRDAALVHHLETTTADAKENARKLRAFIQEIQTPVRLIR